MKLLHTADWHLNDRHGQSDRTRNLQDRVERVAALCEQHAIDVILLAGDVFAERARPDEIAASIRHLRKTFDRFFQRGGTILAVTGNHDQDGRVRPLLEVARAGMDIATRPKKPGDYFETGRFYLIDDPFFGRIRGRDGEEVQFVLFPFPTAPRLRAVIPGAMTPEEIHRPVAQLSAAWIKGLANEAGYDKRLRTILMAHMTIDGADLSHGLFRMSEANDVVFDGNDLPTGFDYVALGHIHKPQCLRAQSHVRYSGSLDRLDFSEKDDEKGVVIVEVGNAGRTKEPQFVPIEATPLVDVIISDSGVDAGSLRSQISETEGALVRVFVEPTATVEGTTAVQAAIQTAFPNLTSVEWRRPEVNTASADRTVAKKSSFRDTVLSYLEQRITEDDPNRGALLDLAKTYLSNGESK